MRRTLGMAGGCVRSCWSAGYSGERASSAHDATAHFSFETVDVQPPAGANSDSVQTCSPSNVLCSTAITEGDARYNQTLAASDIAGTQVRHITSLIQF